MSDSLSLNPASSAPRAVHKSLPWIDTFLGILVAPKQTLHAIRDSEPAGSQFSGACVTVALVSLLEGLRSVSLRHPDAAAFIIPGAVIGGLLTWLAASGAVGLAALAFGQPREKYSTIVATMGWSLLPWIFVGPIACLHNAIGHASALLVLIPAIWVFLLQLAAIHETFNLKLWQTLCLAVVVPLLIAVAQMSQFFQTLCAMFSVAR